MHISLCLQARIYREHVSYAEHDNHAAPGERVWPLNNLMKLIYSIKLAPPVDQIPGDQDSRRLAGPALPSFLIYPEAFWPMSDDLYR